MSILELLERVRRSGILLTVQGDKLRYEAPVGHMTQDLRAALIASKPIILGILQTVQRVPQVQDLGGGRLMDQSIQENFEERAAILEFDGGLSRIDAERTAW